MREHHRYKGSKFLIGARVKNIQTGRLGTVQADFGADCPDTYYPDSWVIPVKWDGSGDNYFLGGGIRGVNDDGLALVENNVLFSKREMPNSRPILIFYYNKEELI